MILDSILEEKNISKSALATMIGAQRQNMNSLLNNPKLSTLEKIANALNVPVWRLFVSEKELKETGNYICPKCHERINIDIKLS